MAKRDIAVIPKGTTEYNEMGFWIDGDYATVKNKYGELFLEVNLTLHHPDHPQVNDYIYMIWMQVYDEKKTEKGVQHYEGFSCAIRYDESIYKQVGSPYIRSNYLERMGYSGNTSLAYEKGTWKTLVFKEQTEDYPWLLQPGKTKMVLDNNNRFYTETCNFYRDFDTVYSNVQLPEVEYLVFDAGFKVWTGPDSREPRWIGHKKNIKWYIDKVDGAIVGLSSATLALGLMLSALWF